MGEPQGVGAAAPRREEAPAERAGVILTPDQRVRVFISSTLEELAAERAAARRAITRLHLVPVWYESGARPHPPLVRHVDVAGQRACPTAGSSPSAPDTT
jgi:hypothetical protein